MKEKKPSFVGFKEYLGTRFTVITKSNDLFLLKHASVRQGLENLAGVIDATNSTSENAERIFKRVREVCTELKDSTGRPLPVFATLISKNIEHYQRYITRLMSLGAFNCLDITNTPIQGIFNYPSALREMNQDIQSNFPDYDPKTYYLPRHGCSDRTGSPRIELI